MRDTEQGEGVAESALRFRVRKNILFIYIFLSAGLVEPVRFNRFQTLETETESNRNFFCDFLIG